MLMRNLNYLKFTPGAFHASKLCKEIKREDFTDEFAGLNLNFKSVEKIKRNLFLLS